MRKFHHPSHIRLPELGQQRLWLNSLRLPILYVPEAATFWVLSGLVNTELVRVAQR